MILCMTKNDGIKFGLVIWVFIFIISTFTAFKPNYIINFSSGLIVALIIGGLGAILANSVLSSMGFSKASNDDKRSKGQYTSERTKQLWFVFTILAHFTYGLIIESFRLTWLHDFTYNYVEVFYLSIQNAAKIFVIFTLILFTTFFFSGEDKQEKVKSYWSA
ncbi:MAG: hypothetical protein HeimC2_34320 [Candidatus Heimdallarchaeota archaeon LC_2]|nr:MAG: hypothetical protein HeimC2_34320 [Candidatus Heimdallarchaeota archaeon LC_2]